MAGQRTSNRLVGLLLGGLALTVVACSGSDDSAGDPAPADAEPASSEPAEALGMSPDELVARGSYLVNHVSVCAECHTPRTPKGALDESRALSGVPCFWDTDLGNDELGCLSTANLSHHETGLKNRTDDEIKDMFLKGVRPDGAALHPFMPYWSLANMSAEDADAIVAYLRTVPGVENQLPPHQAPFDKVAAPTPAARQDQIPAPSADYPDQEAAVRGRYLSSEVGLCWECHTAEAAEGSSEVRDFARGFQGGRSFARDEFHFPPFLPETIVTRNLTPDPDTGLGNWSVEAIVKALKEGVTPDGRMLCPPMPAGPKGGLAGLTDADATDIAHYLKSLPPASSEQPLCHMPPPPPGVGPK